MPISWKGTKAKKAYRLKKTRKTWQVHAVFMIWLNSVQEWQKAVHVH